MPRAVDPHALQVTHDPTYSIQYDLRAAFGQGVDLWQAVIDMIVEKAEDLVKELIQRLIGVPVDLDQALDDLFDLLPDWMPELPDLGELYETLTGIVGATVTDAQQWAEGIRNALHGINLSEPGSILALLGSIFGLNGGSVTLQSVVEAAAQRLFGVVELSRIPHLPIAHLFDGSVELLADPGFDEDFAEGSGFVRDDAAGRTGTGSARCAADGTHHTVVSNVIPVSAGEKMPMSVWSKWAGVAATAGANSIRLSVRGYHTDGGVRTLVSTTLVSGISTPTTTSDSEPGAVGGWVKLSGEYTVPSGVDAVVTEVQVTAAASAGTVWFDDASVTKTSDGMPQEWIKDLIPDLGGLRDLVTSVVNSALAALGIPAVGTLYDRIMDLQDGLADLHGTAHDAFAALASKLGLSDWNEFNSQLLSNPAALLGELPPSIVTGLSGSLTELYQIRDILAGDSVVPINAAVQDVKDWWNSVVGKTQNLSSVGQFDASKLFNLNNIGTLPGTAVQTAVGGATSLDNALQLVIDGVVEGAGGLVGSGFGLLDMLAQVAGLRNAASGANSSVVNLQAQIAALDPAASSEVVDFSEFVNAAAPPSMFTKVNDVGSGSLVTSNGQLAWSGSSAGREFYLFNGGPLQTNLAEVQLVLPQVPSHGWFGDDSSNFLYLIARADAAANNMVLARVGWDEARIFSYNSGTFTQIGAALVRSDLLTGGCRVSFKCGNVLDQRYFNIGINGTVVLEVTDTAPVSSLGSDYRLCGFGVEKGSSYNTGTISTWSMMDGGASAGSGVVVGHTASGLTNMGIWRGTRAQYDSIVTRNPDWVYVVRG